ncbi:hypothetical protein [Alloyangia pacifica]|uniref:Uncharacterized protein n=1 Tax=Alloyangia pacifica TaxID=311180 RepID=A0A1I6QKH7_9RHOB|nr:hypothetical protein [Alloyangia pacifica]SDF91950.1 hypothetical protein SAMN04488245_101134 [Alloyangia pacifica]SFS52983.1 hypothetical protein SAMN04488050_102135 [Alloyangia pacifica]
MAFHGNIEVNSDQPALLTAEDVSGNFLCQNQSGEPVRLIGATDTTVPAADAPGLELAHGAVILNEAMTDLFPSIAAVRVFAVSLSGSGPVLVSYA